MIIFISNQIEFLYCISRTRSIARVLFDGEEIWRGNTSEIWEDKGRNGGYVEVTGYELGLHTLRIESMGFDYHPVTVAFFGFSLQGGVEAGE